MAEGPIESLLERFAQLGDAREECLVRHKLIDIIAIAILAVICGANNWVEIEEYGVAKEAWLRTFLELPHGIPSHDTFGRVFAQIDPVQFGRHFADWVKTIGQMVQKEVIAIDGKTTRGSRDEVSAQKTVHTVSAWATERHLVLGQRQVDEKSNEITALPAVLQMLQLKGPVVTIDTMGCQKNVAQMIIDQQGDYILAVKDNQPTLHQKIKEMFEDAAKVDYAHTSYDNAQYTNKDHGRIETRRCCVIDDENFLLYIQGVEENKRWAGLGSIVKIEATRRRGAEVSTERRYYISSLKTNAALMLQYVRAHWGVENGLHWVLDVAFREDKCRTRRGHSADNFTILRHLAISLLRQDRTVKGGVPCKRLRAAWDDRYLLKLLALWYAIALQRLRRPHSSSGVVLSAYAQLGPAPSCAAPVRLVLRHGSGL